MGLAFARGGVRQPGELSADNRRFKDGGWAKIGQHSGVRPCGWTV